MDIVKSTFYKLRLSAVTLFVLMAVSSVAVAQNFQVSGKVITAAKQKPLAGVTILEVGTQNGTITDANGHFSFEVASGNAKLRFSFIGFKTKVVEVNGRSHITIKLKSSIKNMNQLVVTALGIEQEANSVAYATQSIPTKQLTKAPTPSFVNSLAGKTAGVKITKGSSGPGSASRIVIRGANSFTGNSGPLYVINGVPVGQAAGGAQGEDLFSGLATRGLLNTVYQSNPLSNINPEDIKSIQILKGASAAALYGSQAANGVILITTKKGQGGRTRIHIYSTTTFQSPTHLPDTQTMYGRSTKSQNDSWGKKISDGDNSFIGDFFNTGRTLMNGVSISGGSDMFQFYGSFVNQNQTGIVPNNSMIKDHITFRGTGQFLNDKLTVNASIQHTRQHIKNPPRSGFYRSVTLPLYTFPPSDDFSDYDNEGPKTYKKWNEERGLYVENWPYARNEASSDQNPYWIMNKMLESHFNNRTLLQFKAKYDFTNWLSLQARTTINLNHNRQFVKMYAGASKLVAGSAGARSGNYATSIYNSRSIYADVLLTGSGDISENFSLDGTLGFSNTQGHSYGLNMSSSGTGGLIYANVFTVSNFVSPAVVDGSSQFNYGESEYKNLSQALFATATLGYKNTLYLNLTGRNEWSYTSPESFFYPSIGLSYILTNTIGSDGVLSYAKIRASYAEVGSPLPRGANDRNPPFSINTNTGSVNTGQTLPYFSGTDTTTLVPERTQSFEVGLDLGFLKNKLNVSLTYYDATTKNQIFTIAAPIGSGAANFYINGGSIRNFGIDAVVSYSTDIGQVHWNTSLNFSHNVNQIRQISDLLDADRFVVASSDGTRLVASFLTRPKNGHYGSFGDYYGRTIKKNSAGEVVLDDKGLPVLTAQDASFVGNPTPDYMAGFNNTFHYKGLSLSFLIDGQFGGYVYSLTEAWLDYKGLSQRTARARKRGYIMINGQKMNSQTTGTDDYIHKYFLRISGGGNYPAVKQYRYSATNIRLRELSIGYTFSHLGDFFDSVSLSLVGHNLFFFYKDAPYDPGMSMGPTSNLQGINAFGLPTTRSYGFNVDVRL